MISIYFQHIECIVVVTLAVIDVLFVGCFFATWRKIIISFHEIIRFVLTHWVRDKMTTIWQTTFQNAFSCTKTFQFQVQYHWNVLLGSNWQYVIIGPDKGNRLSSDPKMTQFIDTYSISQEICTRFCCALLCCGYAIVHNEFTWSIYPYSSGLLCWHVRLPQCQWSKPDGYGKISQCITTTKHSKAKTVCIFLGIYCTLPKLNQFRGRHLRESKHFTNQAETADVFILQVIFKIEINTYI